jgi:hypothetical protein
MFPKLIPSLLGVLTLLHSSSASAGAVFLTTYQGRQLTTSSGSALPAGCCIRIGSFFLPDATRDATLAATKDFNQLRTWFKPLAEGISGSGSVEQSGSANGQLRTNDYPLPGEVLGMISGISSSYVTTGTQLYVWVFDAATPEAAQQWGIFKADTWTVPPSLGSQSLATTSAVTALHGSVTATQMKLLPIPVNYGNWSMSKIGSSASSQALSGSEDVDSDGLKNLMEYAWGLDPKAFNAARSSISTSGTPSFSFQAPKGKPDVTLQAECSTDMISWAAVSSTITATDAQFDTHTVTAPNGNKCFWRVKFSPTSP